MLILSFDILGFSIFKVQHLPLAASTMLLGIYLRVHVHYVVLALTDTPRMESYAGIALPIFTSSAVNLLNLLKK